MRLRCGSFQTDDGRSLNKAIAWFLPYLTGEETWHWKRIKPFHAQSMIGPLSACTHGYHQAKYRNAIARLPKLAEDDRSHLL
jgi:hypothetical protein